MDLVFGFEYFNDTVLSILPILIQETILIYYFDI